MPDRASPGDPRRPARRPRGTLPDHVLAHLPRRGEGGLAPRSRRCDPPAERTVRRRRRLPDGGRASTRRGRRGARADASRGGRLGRRRRHASRDQVSARALREPSRRGRRRRRCLGLRAGGTDPPRAPDRGADRGGRPGDPLVPAARGRAGARRCAPRAGERHGDHEAWPGRRRHGCARPRGRRTQRPRPRPIRASGASAGGADRSRHRDQRRARRVEPRPVRGVGPHACRHRPAGHRRGGGGPPVVPGRHLRAVGRRRPLPACWISAAVRRSSSSGASPGGPSSGSAPRWARSG